MSEPHAKFGENQQRTVDVIANRNQMQNLYISKIRFLFPVSFAIEYKVDIAEFYLYVGFGADLLKNMVTRARKLPKIGIRTPLQSTNYFRFVWQTISVDATTFLSRMQNLVKIGKKNCGCNRSRTDLFTNTQTDRQTDRQTEKNWLVGLSNALGRQQWATLSPKIAPSHGGSGHRLIYDSLGQSESTIQMASWSVQLFSLRWLLGIPNPDHYFQTRVSGLDVLKPGFRVRVCNSEE